MRSKGSEVFKASGGTSTEWAAKLGVSVPHVSNLRNGKASASAEMRAKIFSHGGPAPALWDTMLPESLPNTPRDPAPPAVASADETRKLADRLQGMAEAALDEIATTAEGGLEGRVRTLEKAAGVIAALGKITGASELNERRILMTPAFRRIRDATCTALLPFPDALEAVTLLFERMASE